MEQAGEKMGPSGLAQAVRLGSWVASDATKLATKAWRVDTMGRKDESPRTRTEPFWWDDAQKAPGEVGRGAKKRTACAPFHLP